VSTACPAGLRVLAPFCAILRDLGKTAMRVSRKIKDLMADPARFELTTSAFGGQRSF
jgi:hypothetical protein